VVFGVTLGVTLFAVSHFTVLKSQKEYLFKNKNSPGRGLFFAVKIICEN
jgi:hypothetical protein